MKASTLCCLFGVFIFPSISAYQYYFVTGPNVIRFEHGEIFTVSIFGIGENVRISVWFEHRNKEFSKRTVIVPNQEMTQQVTVKVTENDIFDTVIEEKPRKINMCSRRDNDVKICRKLVLSYRTGYLIVQTDKPIYTPRKPVNIRVLAMDENLKKIGGDKWQVAMDIVSPSNLTLGRKTFSSTTSSGFYKNTFWLPPHPQPGLWTARAFYKGQFETVARSLFKVEEYVLPTFGVTVDVSVPYILKFSAEQITITVKAEYVYGKPVDGRARLTLNVTDNAGNSRYLFDMPRKSLNKGVTDFGFESSEVLNHPAMEDADFTKGSRFLIVATVIESATGKEESTYNDDTVFALEPYIFKFTKTKKYFRPGMEYYLKVDVQKANRQPSIGLLIRMTRLDESGREIAEKVTTTDSRGHAIGIFSTSAVGITSGGNVLKFEVKTQNNAQASEVIEIHSYEDKNQILVERLITNNSTMLMRATTNIQLDGTSSSSRYTGMLFMIVVRGQVVKTVFKPPSNQVSEQITEDLQELVSPSARLLVMYVDTVTQKIVADSIKIEVDPKCRKRGLTLNPGRVQVVPGEGDMLAISGTPMSWVGLNAMDKALLLLDSENVLKKSKMFDALRSHDLGCGEGGGRNNGDVFKNAGMTVLTNARIESDISRLSEECETKKRKKRSTDDCYEADMKCCLYGRWYAEKVFNEAETDEEKAKIDQYTKCFAAAVANTTKSVGTPCVLAILWSCIELLEERISSITLLASRSLDDESDYASDLELLSQYNIRPSKRTYFPESFMFEEIQLSADGTSEKPFTYPDSITEWRIQAISITENVGMCIADPVDVTVFRRFFVQLDLPYKATRLELFDVKATLFNYGMETDKVKQANMYLEGVEGLCYTGEPGKPSPKTSLEIGPNSAKTVRFPMVALKAGLFPITITAIVVNLGIPEVDIIEKKLFVVNEGIQEIITIQVCLDPNQQREDCEDGTQVETKHGIKSTTGHREQISTVDLRLPSDAISGTGSATAYIQGDIMDNVVNIVLSGTDSNSLFPQPTGCGEQMISSTALNVYAIMFLKRTTQMTAFAESNGYSNIKYGVDREKSKYQNPDGSYSVSKGQSTSVCLTAIVAKVFCHAKSIVDDALDEQADLYKTIRFLYGTISTSTGKSKEIGTDYYCYRDDKVVSLTATVLISLLECKLLPNEISSSVDQATRFIETRDEGWLKSRPFELAICAYALSLTKSDKRETFKNWLHSIQRKSGENVYWSKSAGSSGDSSSIETTAYALLAMLQFNDLKTSGKITRWLTSQQKSNGIFISTRDTRIALQALSEYNIRTYTAEMDLQVSVLASGMITQEMAVKKEKFQLQQIVDREGFTGKRLICKRKRNADKSLDWDKLPVEQGDNKVTVKVTGTTGSGRMRIDLRYNRPAESDEICPFDLSDIEVGKVLLNRIDTNIANQRNCDVCGKCANDPGVEDFRPIDIPEEDSDNLNDADSAFGRRKRQAVAETSTDNRKCIRFSVKAKTGHQYGMSMIYFHLETGVTVLKEDMDKVMNNNDNVDDYEMPTNGNGFVVFYLNTLSDSNDNNFVFRVVDNFEGDKESRQPVSVDVFDYYNPEKYCRKFYGTGKNQDPSVEHKCNEENKQCRCIQSLCVQNVEKAIISLAQSGKRPAFKLSSYTCNPEKANFATIVRFTKIDKDDGKKQTMATAIVVRALHQGFKEHSKSNSLSFIWKTNCDYPQVEVGKEYYIIAKDGHTVGGEGDAEYQYPLMGTALVVQNYKRARPPKQKRIKTIMNNYETLLKRSVGCDQ